MQRIVEGGKKRAGGIFLIRIMEIFSCYKISFVIFQSKKTAREDKKVEPTPLKNYECAKRSQIAR